LVAGQAQQGRQEVLAFDLCGIRRHLLPDGAAEHNKKSYRQTLKIILLFTQNLSLSYQKYGFDIRDPENPIPDP
jgi:hypothetical protein